MSSRALGTNGSSVVHLSCHFSDVESSGSLKKINELIGVLEIQTKKSIETRGHRDQHLVLNVLEKK